METASLSLWYVENDPRTEKSVAGVYVKLCGGQECAHLEPNKLLTVQCASIIELDAEIRRLHAELDEIRAQAKRKFYKAEATLESPSSSR